MIIITFLTAFSLSAIAAYYSVIGLAAIFSGAFYPVIIMGSILEISKLVSASWLYRNWKTAPLLLKIYLTFAVVILMLITSMGIFGFLSKSHIDSTLDSNSNVIELKTLQQSEKQLNERLEYLLNQSKKTDKTGTIINRLDKQIQETQRQLQEVNKNKLPLLKKENEVLADIGPVKYVADMIYGNDANAIDKAIRLVIIIIMLVFDPLAVLLLIAANASLKDSEPIEQSKTFKSEKPKKQKTSKESTIEVPKTNLFNIDDDIKTSEVDEKITTYIAPDVYEERIVKRKK